MLVHGGGADGRGPGEEVTAARGPGERGRGSAYLEDGIPSRIAIRRK